DLLVVVVLAFHRTDLAGRARGRLHGGPEPVRGPAGHVHDPPRVGERGGHALAHAPAAAGDQCDPGAHESAPAVAAPGTASTSGNVTVASSSDRVTDQPGVNRHSAITQRSSSTTYTSEYSPVESVSVPWSRSTSRHCVVHVPVARCGACPASGSSTVREGMNPWCMSRIRGPPSVAVARAILRKMPTIVSGSVRPSGPKSRTPPVATKQARNPSGSLASQARQ